jgi:hypothetical protein
MLDAAAWVLVIIESNNVCLVPACVLSDATI